MLVVAIVVLVLGLAFGAVVFAVGGEQSYIGLIFAGAVVLIGLLGLRAPGRARRRVAAAVADDGIAFAADPNRLRLGSRTLAWSDIREVVFDAFDDRAGGRGVSRIGAQIGQNAARTAGTSDRLSVIAFLHQGEPVLYNFGTLLSPEEFNAAAQAVQGLARVPVRFSNRGGSQVILDAELAELERQHPEFRG